MSENETFDDQPEVDPIAEAILHGGSAPQQDEPVESGADTPIGESQDEQPSELILGKFKTADDLAEAYRNLETQFTQNNQRLSDLEMLLMEDDEEDVQPWGATFGGEPQNEEQLIGWAERDPGAAAQWAIANSGRVPQETVNGLWEHWFEQKPTEAMAWYTQQQAEQIRQQYEAELEALREQVTPLRDAQTQNMFEGAMTSLESQIPDLSDYADKIEAYIENIPVDQLHLAFFPNGMDTPEKVQEGVKSLYAVVRMREAPANFAQQQQAVMPSAITQSRQGVIDTGPEDYAAKINAAILNG